MMLRRRRPAVAARARGAALIVLMALLTMGVLYFLTVQLEALSGYGKESRGASDSLAQAREALLGYAATYRDAHSGEVFGYLPCPDTSGKTGIQTPGDGEAASTCGTAGQAAIGLLPYRTLGIPDLRDSSGVCLWYAVAGTFKNNPKATATVMNWDTQGQFSVVDANATTLVAPDDSQGGAAAVIFATGLPLAGQSRSATSVGPCQIDPAQVAAFLDGAYSFATSSPITLTQGPVKDAYGGITNNDRIAWITPKEIFDRVIRRQDFANALTATAPGQINTLIDRLAKAVEKQIQDDIFNATSTSMPSNTASYTPQPGSAAMGDVNATTDISVAGSTDNYAKYLSNWSDQMRQIRCNSVSTACLDINNSGTANCRGALLFAGRTAGGQPRTSVQKVPSIANLANYFESGIGLLTSGSAFGGRTAYAEAVSLSAATWSGGTVTVTTSSAHGFGTDFDVAISGVSPSGYNGTYRIAVTDATHFTFALATNPGTYVSAGSAFSSSVDVAACLGYGSFVSLKADAAQFATGTITPGGGGSGVAAVTGVGGASPEIVLGSTTANSRAGCVWYPTALPLESSLRVYFKYRIDSATTGSTARGYALALADAATNSPFSIDPLMCGARGTTSLGYAGAPVSGTATVSTTQTIASTSWSYSTGLATITTVLAHGFHVGDSVTIAGASPKGYNGTYTIVSTGGPFTPTFSYSVAYPGPLRAGIAPPKLGVEFDTNPDTLTTQRNDPSTEHFAFLYWGSAGDNNMHAASTTRDGSDDNYHGSGVAGDGSQPLNPRSLTTTSAAATPVATMAAAQWSAGTATVTTSAPHGFPNGQRVVVSDTGPLGYQGTYTATVTDATHFTYPLAANPGKYPYVATVSAASSAAGIVTLTTSAAHGLATGDNVTVSDLSPSVWNGSYAVTVTDPTHFTFTIPSAYVSAASWSAGTATITTSAAHGLTTGNAATVSNMAPSTWNGIFQVTVTDATHFTVAMASNPGAYSSGGTIALPTNPCIYAAGCRVSSPLSFVGAASWSGGIVTMTTAAAHNLVNNQSVTISGILPSGYNGTFQVTVTDATHFTYPLTNPATNPGAYVSGGLVALAGVASTVMAGTSTNVSNASWSSSGSGTASVTTAVAHGLSVGQTAYVGGIVSTGPASYNGVYAITAVPTPTRFSYGQSTYPGTYSSSGLVAIATPTSATINSATWSSTSGGKATLGTAAAHGFTTGQIVNIGGIAPGGYNGAYAITVIDATHFTYALAADPGDSFAAATFSTPGIATTNGAHPYITDPIDGSSTSTMPLDTDIHVRLDVVRSYDASKHQATVTLRAYIGNTFALAGNCGLAEFKNFTRDLSALCPIRTPTIEQNGILVNDVAGPALRKIYFGYSTARGPNPNDNETIHIQNLILRSQ